MRKYEKHQVIQFHLVGRRPIRLRKYPNHTDQQLIDRALKELFGKQAFAILIFPSDIVVGEKYKLDTVKVGIFTYSYKILEKNKQNKKPGLKQQSEFERLSEKIPALLGAGKTITEMAKDLCSNRDYICKCLKQLGLKPLGKRGIGAFLSQEEKQQIETLYNQGFSFYRIAKEVNRSYSCVRNWILLGEK